MRGQTVGPQRFDTATIFFENVAGKIVESGNRWAATGPRVGHGYVLSYVFQNSVTRPKNGPEPLGRNGSGRLVPGPFPPFFDISAFLVTKSNKNFPFSKIAFFVTFSAKTRVSAPRSGAVRPAAWPRAGPSARTPGCRNGPPEKFNRSKMHVALAFSVDMCYNGIIGRKEEAIWKEGRTGVRPTPPRTCSR